MLSCSQRLVLVGSYSRAEIVVVVIVIRLALVVGMHGIHPQEVVFQAMRGLPFRIGHVSPWIDQTGHRDTETQSPIWLPLEFPLCLCVSVAWLIRMAP